MRKRLKCPMRMLIIFLSFILFACSGGDNGSLISYLSDGNPGSDSVTMETLSSSGNMLSLAMKVADIAEPFKGAGIELTYDPAIVSITSVTQGDILHGSVAFISTDEGNGSLLISNIDSSISPGRDGILCVVNFRGIAAGESALTLLSSSAIFNGSGDPIPNLSWIGGKVVME